MAPANTLAAPAPEAERQLAVNPKLGFLESAIATFEGVDRLAQLMAKMGTLPKHLQGQPADCFRVVVQAAKWGMDPFAVAECTSLVHGRMCFEGKLVAAVLQRMNAIEGRLSFEFSGEGQAMSVVVSGKPRGGKVETLRGSVKDWRTHTMKDGREIPNAWDKDPQSMLVYRGTRQWARLYTDAMLGVSTPDEFDDVREVEAEVIGTVPDAKPAKAREVPVEAAPAPAAAITAHPAEQQNIGGMAAPAPAPAAEKPSTPTSRKSLNEACISFASAFKQRAVDELKEINKALGIAKMQDCPEEKIPEALRLVKAADERFVAKLRAELQAAADAEAKAKAAAQSGGAA
jgi:hypothetical protein